MLKRYRLQDMWDNFRPVHRHHRDVIAGPASVVGSQAIDNVFKNSAVWSGIDHIVRNTHCECAAAKGLLLCEQDWGNEYAALMK